MDIDVAKALSYDLDKTTFTRKEEFLKQNGGHMSRLEVERKLLSIVNLHTRIIQLKSFSDTGIYLERTVNGTLADYLLESGNPPPSTQQRLSWC